MITINSISKREEKLDLKGKPCINYTVNVEHEGEAVNAYITSYAGEIKPGDKLDIKLAQKTGKTGRTYWSGYWYADKNNPAPVHTAPPVIAAKKYTPEELQGIMDRCIAYGLKAAARFQDSGIDPANITACINSLFIAHTSHGHRPNDWMQPVAAPAEISPLKETLHWEIGDWIKAGKISETDVISTVRLVGKVSTFAELTEAQATEVHARVKKQVEAKK